MDLRLPVMGAEVRFFSGKEAKIGKKSCMEDERLI